MFDPEMQLIKCEAIAPKYCLMLNDTGRIVYDGTLSGLLDFANPPGNIICMNESDFESFDAFRKKMGYEPISSEPYRLG